MIVFLIQILKYFLRFIYSLFKLRKINQNKITLISRQSDTISDDFNSIKKYILASNKNIKVTILCKKMNKCVILKPLYILEIIKQMWHLSTSSVCIIDGYIIPISILKHKSSLCIIQIWHAVGTVKKFGHQTLGKKGGRGIKVSQALCIHKNYDVIFSGSETMIEVFAQAFNSLNNNIKVISPAKIIDMKENYNKIKNSIIDKYPEISDK